LIRELELGTGKLLITYSTCHLNANDLVRFFYALKGRDGASGLLKATQGLFLSKSVLLCPLSTEKKWLEFFRNWSCPVQVRILRPQHSEKLAKLASDFAKQHKEVSDILLVDGAVFLSLNAPAEELDEKFRKISGTETYTVLTAQLFKPENKSWLEKLSRGISLLGPIEKTTLFLYNSSHLKGSEKVKFFYALKGRGNKPGILATTHSEFVAKSVLLAPGAGASELANFFDSWKCSILKKEVIVKEK